MTATKKQLRISESHSNSNRCTPCRGKPDQHATCFPRSVHVWPLTIRISCGPRIAINRFELIHHPWEEGLPTQSTTWWLTDPWVHTQVLSHNSQWSSREKSSFYWQLATRLTRPIYQHEIGMFNTCLRGPTHRSLTNTGGATTLEVPGFHIPLLDLPNWQSPLST
jgi:hypothetical protein